MNLQDRVELLAIAVPIALLRSSLVDWATVLFGQSSLEEFRRKKECERMQARRHLRRWQVILIDGVLGSGLCMALCFLAVDYAPSRFSSAHHFYAGMIPAYFVLFLGMGVWDGIRSWHRVWDHRYDSAL